MAQINKPTDYFNTKLYTGTGSSQSITGVNFQPDFTWVKDRDTAGYNHVLNDNVRGVTKYLRSNLTNAEATITDAITSFDSDGFTLGSDTSNGEHNRSGINYASWNWLGANGTASNTDGSITSTVSANTTSGFSIVSYTGNATAGATVGHGLGVTPDMFIVKVRSTTNNWAVYHKSMGATKAMYLDGTSAETTDGWLNNTAPDSSVFTLSGGNYGNTSGNTHIAYCFAEKKGFSKFGSYTGNGNADGPFVYTGFKPAWVMIKRTDSTSDWYMYDNKRDSINVMSRRLESNNSDSEVNSPSAKMDFVSNGIKFRGTDSAFNVSGASYIYMCFAESPLVGTNNTPATAR